jgi:hypothetical protein
MKLSITQFSPATSTLLYSNILLSISLSSDLNLSTSLTARDLVSHPYTPEHNEENYSFVYFSLSVFREVTGSF